VTKLCAQKNLLAGEKTTKDILMDLSIAQSTGLSRIKPTLEFLGNTTILVVLMGLPATVYHYSIFHVPIALLSYRRVLEAGLFPATLVVLFLIYLFWVERKSSGPEKSVLAGVADTLPRRHIADFYLSLPAIPFMIPAVFVCLTGALAIFLWLFWGIGWVFVKSIAWGFDELTLSGRWITFIGFSIFVLLFIGFYHGMKIIHKREITTDLSKTREDIPSLNQSTEDSYNTPTKPINRSGMWPFPPGIPPKTLKDSLGRSLLLYLMLPPLFMLYAYLTKTAILLVDLPWRVTERITGEVLLMGGIFMGIAYAQFMSAQLLGTFVGSQDEKASEGAKIARRMTYGVFIVACIVLYSLYIYPHLPRVYGGGHPEILDIVTDGSAIPNHLRHLFADNTSKNLYIENIQLIDKTTDEVVFCKAQQTAHICLALPNSSIVSMSWKYGCSMRTGDSE